MISDGNDEVKGLLASDEAREENEIENIVETVI